MASSVGPIRPARASDYEAIVALQVEPELDPIPDASRWEREQMPRTLVYDRDGVIGFINAYATEHHGYVRHVAVAPTSRRAGIGLALMRAAADGFRERGLAQWQLHVRTDNATARALYERLGMQQRDRFTLVRIEWDRITTLPVADGIAVEVMTDDAAIATALGIAPDRLASTRRPGQLFVRLRDASGVIGAAGFLPAVAGVMPLRLARPELLAELLRALAPHALPDRSWAQLGFEDDDSLVPRLESLGGVVRSRTFRYVGAL